MYRLKEDIFNLPNFALKYAEEGEDFNIKKQKYDTILRKLQNIGIFTQDSSIAELTLYLSQYNYIVIGNFNNKKSIGFLCTEQHEIPKFTEEEAFIEISSRDSESGIIIQTKKVETMQPVIKEEILQKLYGY
jgi:hypothetical protein